MTELSQIYALLVPMVTGRIDRDGLPVADVLALKAALTRWDQRAGRGVLGNIEREALMAAQITGG